MLERDRGSHGSVTITLRDVTIQAYLSNSNFSKEETHSMQDRPSPTTVPPSPLPSLVPTNPTVAKYNVTGKNGTCLLASMALQLNITYLKKDNNTVGGVGGWFIHERNMVMQVVVQN